MKGIRAVPQLQQNITMNDKRFVFEVDTGAGDNFCTMAVWKQLGNPTLLPTTGQYEVANGEPLPTLGVCTAAVALQGTNSPSIPLQFTVIKVPHLNLLGRDAIVRLGINVSAYNQIQLSPESQKRLALSTHRGVLLQMRLPFGISSAPGYFQELMDKLTCDLQGVAVYMDDILVSGATDSEHLQNLRSLLKRLVEKGLRCRLEKCSFAQSSIEYFGHTLSRQGGKRWML